MQGIIYSAFLDDKLVVVTPSQGKTFPSCFPSPPWIPKMEFYLLALCSFPEKEEENLCFPLFPQMWKTTKDFSGLQKIPFFFFLEQNRMKEEEEERLFPCPERFAPLSTIAANDANLFSLQNC